MKTICGVKIPSAKDMDCCSRRIENIMANLCFSSQNPKDAVEEMLYAVFYRRGKNQSDIARELGVTRQCISKFLKKSNFVRNIKETKEKEKAKIARLVYEDYKNRVHVCEIAQKYHLNSLNDVYSIAQKYAKDHHKKWTSRKTSRVKKGTSEK